MDCSIHNTISCWCYRRFRQINVYIKPLRTLLWTAHSKSAKQWAHSFTGIFPKQNPLWQRKKRMENVTKKSIERNYRARRGWIRKVCGFRRKEFVVKKKNRSLLTIIQLRKLRQRTWDATTREKVFPESSIAMLLQASFWLYPRPHVWPYPRSCRHLTLIDSDLNRHVF